MLSWLMFLQPITPLLSSLNHQNTSKMISIKSRGSGGYKTLEKYKDKPQNLKLTVSYFSLTLGFLFHLKSIGDELKALFSYVGDRYEVFKELESCIMPRNEENGYKRISSIKMRCFQA